MKAMINFPLTSGEMYSSACRALGISDFHSACEYLLHLPYGRNANRHDFLLTLAEGKGTCSSKHAILAYLADENGQKEIELIVGIFLMSAETHPKLAGFFSGKPYDCFPEAHCYLRYHGERFDFTDASNALERIAPKIVREQRAETAAIGGVEANDPQTLFGRLAEKESADRIECRRTLEGERSGYSGTFEIGFQRLPTGKHNFIKL